MFHPNAYMNIVYAHIIHYLNKVMSCKSVTIFPMRSGPMDLFVQALCFFIKTAAHEVEVGGKSLFAQKRQFR